MNPDGSIKILVLLLAFAIITTSIISLGTSSDATLSNSSVNVPPAKLIWEKNYGILGDDDRAYYALPTSDGYLVVGSSESSKTGVTVGWALRLDQNGNSIWNRTFLDGFGTELRYAINLTSGFLLVGNEFLPSGAVNGYVAKIGDQGNLIWNITVSGNEVDELYSAIAAQNGFVLLGSSSYGTNGDSYAWIVNIDSTGNILWNKTYGNATNTIARTGVLAPDGDYIVAGYTDPRGENNYDFLLIKIDTNGNIMWNKTYGGTGTQEAHSITTASNGYVVVGDTQSTGTDIHAWVLKVDFNGNIIWAKTVGGKKADSPSYITPAKDGGYLVTGFTFSFGAGNRDLWLFKIDDSGQVNWSCTQGDNGYQEAYTVIDNSNNQYVVVGWTDPPGQPTLIGKARYEFYIIKIDPPQANAGFLNLQFVTFAVITLSALIAALLLVLRIRQKSGPKIKIAEMVTQSLFSKS